MILRRFKIYSFYRTEYAVALRSANEDSLNDRQHALRPVNNDHDKRQPRTLRSATVDAKEKI